MRMPTSNFFLYNIINFKAYLLLHLQVQQLHSLVYPWHLEYKENMILHTLHTLHLTDMCFSSDVRLVTWGRLYNRCSLNFNTERYKFRVTPLTHNG